MQESSVNVTHYTVRQGINQGEKRIKCNISFSILQLSRQHDGIIPGNAGDKLHIRRNVRHLSRLHKCCGTNGEVRRGRSPSAQGGVSEGGRSPPLTGEMRRRGAKLPFDCNRIPVLCPGGGSFSARRRKTFLTNPPAGSAATRWICRRPQAALPSSQLKKVARRPLF